MATKINMSATEDHEQATLFSWASMQIKKYPELALLFHIPNGGKRNAAEAARFRAEGVKAGVPDLMLPVARNGKHGLWIEMKRREGGRVSAHQSEWLQSLAEQGYECRVCYGWEEAAEVLKGYLEGSLIPSVSPQADSPPCNKGGLNQGKRKGKGFDFDRWVDEL